jgi:hypothetical protein
MAQTKGTTCLTCGRAIASHDLEVMCPVCETTYHPECWQKRPGCSNPDCGAVADGWDEYAAEWFGDAPTRQRVPWRLILWGALVFVVGGVTALWVARAHTGRPVLSRLTASREAPRIPGSLVIADEEGLVVRPAAGGESRRLVGQRETHPAVSPDGRQVVCVSRRHGNSELYLMNLDGTGERRLTTTPGHENWPAFSPDGLHVAYSLGTIGAESSLWVMTLAEGKSRQITEWKTVGGAEQPVFDPTGTHLLFTRWIASEQTGLASVPVLGGELVNIALGDDCPSAFHGRFTPDGRSLLFCGGESPLSGASAIYRVAVGGGTPQRVTLPLAAEQSERCEAPAVSPDGRWLAFTATNLTMRWAEREVEESERPRLFLMPLAGGNRIELGSGTEAVWVPPAIVSAPVVEAPAVPAGEAQTDP